MTTTPTETNVEFELAVAGQNCFKINDRIGDEIEINPDLSYDEWKSGLTFFKVAKVKLQLGFAKYLSFGSQKFGSERMSDALAQLEFDMPMVKSALAVGTVPVELRRPSLTAEHYTVMARSGLQKKDLEKWADTAEEQKLDPSTLKASIQMGEVVTPGLAKKQNHGVLTVHAVAAEFTIWLKRVGGVKGIKKMEIENIKEVIGELKQAAEVYQELVDFIN